MRRLLSFVGSVALGVLLILILVRLARIDIATALKQLRAAKISALVNLILLNAALIFVSTEKWRSVDAALRTSSDPVPSRMVSFVLTSIGMALGFVLPVQLGMAAARTVGTHFYGKPFRRGMAGSIFEQSFDVLLVCVLALASGFTVLVRGRASSWIATATVATVVTFILAGHGMRVTRKLAAALGRRMRPETQLAAGLRRLVELEESGVLSARLARRLVMLSALRFGIVVLMAGQTAAAIGAQIPLWHLAAAMPLVVLASALAITPGGIGVTELAYTGTLNLFGTPTSVAAAWAIANRVLCIAACYVVATAAAGIFASGRLLAARHPFGPSRITIGSDGKGCGGPK